MKYALLLYADEADWEGLDPEAQGEVMAQHGAATEAMQSAGAYVGGEALDLTNTAKTLRLRDGKPVVTDGPFIEAKEALGGFYLVECASMDEALDFAARIPEARTGAVEVRPILDFDALEAEAAG
ncbi:MAG TPA: YciI family protein [Candidatus Limnocylindrales bacterium]|nr:YciI family protein [Candidatus Limnocylindrales bacterium]